VYIKSAKLLEKISSIKKNYVLSYFISKNVCKSKIIYHSVNKFCNNGKCTSRNVASNKIIVLLKGFMSYKKIMIIITISNSELIQNLIIYAQNLKDIFLSFCQQSKAEKGLTLI